MLPTSAFITYVQHHKLFDLSDKILLGVSGGKDSVLMAHLFNAAGLNFGIAHCNFSLRGEESDSDEAFVRELAKKFRVSFFCIKFETAAFAQEKRISIQMAARQLRYEWFESIRDENRYQYIAVAHHKSDATETMLLNMVRGTGIAGLHGIIAKRNFILRPLLFLKSEEINSIIADNNIAYREDSSNTSVKYARNKIRHEVIPKLKMLNKDLDDTFAENSQRFAELEMFLDLQVAKLRTKLFIDSGTNIQIPLDALKSLNPRNLLLYEIFKPYNFNETSLHDLINVWDNQPGKMFESASHTLLVDRDMLILKARSATPESEHLVAEKDRLFHWKGKEFRTDCKKPTDHHFTGNNNIAYLDATLLQFPLKLRLWNRGDYFFPFGMKGKKKLSDYFTNQKLSRFEKDETGILENGNGDILWVVGYRSDERYKITPHTQNIYTIEISQ